MILKKFQEFDKLVRIILLAVPFCNWVVEIVLRWSLFLEKKDVVSLVIALISTVGGGLFLGWIDAVYTALNDKICLTDVEIK